MRFDACSASGAEARFGTRGTLYPGHVARSRPSKPRLGRAMLRAMTHGGDIIADVLARHGVTHLFTLCGGHISPILTGAKAKGIDVVDVRDEGNAVFAADAVSRMTGTIGAAAVTAGPGVTNTVTAIKNAAM